MSPLLVVFVVALSLRMCESIVVKNDEGVTLVVGKPGDNLNLSCPVGDAARRGEPVSWLRDADELLTFGQLVYGGRFGAAFAPPDDWRLVVKNARLDDSGHYECRLGADWWPWRRVRLLIKRPLLSVTDGKGSSVKEIFVTKGMLLELRCSSDAIPTPPLRWTRGSTSVSSSGMLKIAKIKWNQAGTYSCVAPDGTSASVLVRVFKGNYFTSDACRVSIAALTPLIVAVFVVRR